MTHANVSQPRAPYPAWTGLLMLAALLLATAGTLAAAGLGPRLVDLPQQWTDDRGVLVALDKLHGRRVVLTMAYANCHKICPATIRHLQRLERALSARGDSAEFVVIGYDPANESPADWRRYRERTGLSGAHWHFLSGSRDDTARVARQLGFSFWKYDDHVMHDARVVVFNDEGTLSAALGPEQGDWLAAL